MSAETPEPGDDISGTALAALGRQLAAGDLSDLAVFVAMTRSGREIAWTRSSADMLRLVGALVDNLVADADSEGLDTALEALASHEVDAFAASLAQLHHKLTSSASGHEKQ